MPWALPFSPHAPRPLEASRGATDFGEYFTYFSFFLVVSALMLTVLFFKLGIEQRLRQIGILRASGYSMPVIRRLLLSEATVLAVVGALLGIVGAILYGRLIVYGLGTWWVGAVGTTRLQLHVSPISLTLGALGGVIAAIVCVLVSLRAVARVAPRVLLTSQSLDVSRAPDDRKARRSRVIASACGVAALALLAAGFLMRISAGRRVLCRRGTPARRLAALACRLAATSRHWLDYRPRVVGCLAARLPQRRVSAGTQRSVRRLDCIGGVHHRVRRRFSS